jgi:hypothetical protein
MATHRWVWLARTAIKRIPLAGFGERMATAKPPHLLPQGLPHWRPNCLRSRANLSKRSWEPSLNWGIRRSLSAALSSVTDEQHAAALANLYPEAAARVNACWDRGRLEARAASPMSSQALCVSVFEPLAGRPAPHRRAVLNAICASAGLGTPVHGTARVEAEVRRHRSVLGEIGGGTPTALDALVTWDEGVLTVESKFNEPEFGSCGQLKPLRMKLDDPRYNPGFPELREANCSGHHAVGSDRKPTTSPLGAACRLTVKDGGRAPRRYWAVAPRRNRWLDWYLEFEGVGRQQLAVGVRTATDDRERSVTLSRRRGIRNIESGRPTHASSEPQLPVATIPGARARASRRQGRGCPVVSGLQ